MSRNWDGSASTNNLSISDITSARFDVTTDWACGAFFRIENFATDDRVIVAKWAGGSSQRAFMIRTNTSGQMEVYMRNAIRITGSALSTDTWYLVVITNDSSAGGVNNLILYTVDMDESFADDGVTGSNASNASNLTVDITIAARDLNDPMDGDIAYAFYSNHLYTRDNVRSHLRNPHMMANAASGNLEFLIPIIGASPEPDWGGDGNNFTVNGSSTVSDMPPVSPPFADILLAEAAAQAIPPTASWFQDIKYPMSNYEEVIHG